VGCCGETAQGRLTITQKDIDNGLALQIEYGGGRTVTVRGPITGKSYVFSGLSRIQTSILATPRRFCEIGFFD